MMTFPSFWFFGFINHMGWPWTTGLLRRKKVVSHSVVWSAIKVLARSSIALGALRPKVAVSLLADLFIERDWQRQTAIELWAQLDPSEKVVAQPEKLPEEIIADYPVNVSVPTNQKELQRDLIAWENILQEKFGLYCHWVFASGLVWGLSHPEEALTCYERERKKYLDILPDALSHGLDVHSPETLEEFADAMEESVNSFQDEIRPLAEVPQELLDLPIIKDRINQQETKQDVHMEVK